MFLFLTEAVDLLLMVIKTALTLVTLRITLLKAERQIFLFSNSYLANLGLILPEIVSKILYSSSSFIYIRGHSFLKVHGWVDKLSQKK